MIRKKQNAQNGKRWMHPPEALLAGHIIYNVKFLGNIEVQEPKGIEVVKDAIRKLKFNKQILRAEGQKPPKVELTISVDGVGIQEAKYKILQSSFPLHRISYCADDKSDKRMFSFIAKEGDSHLCFVFDSEKCAEEITLTIGQAFDLAYKKFLETSGKDMDAKKQFLLLQKKVKELTEENLKLKARVADLERHVDPKYLEELDSNPNAKPSNDETAPSVGRRLENLVFDETNNGQNEKPTTNGISSSNAAMPVLAPPPRVPPRSNQGNQNLNQPKQQSIDLFGAEPFNPDLSAKVQPVPANNTNHPALPTQVQPVPANKSNPFGPSEDPFGMGNFASSPVVASSGGQDLDTQIQSMDKELFDLQAGFSAGLSMGTEDFNLEDLDPLKN